MPQTATNPKTGEKLVLVNGQWMPVGRTAVNPDTGERVGFVGGQWVSLGLGEKKSVIEEIPLVGGVLGQLADYPAAAVQGLAGGVKTLTDVFGAGNVASDVLGDISEGARNLRSAESRASERGRAARSKAAEGKGFLEEAKAAIQNFAAAPLETTAQAAGSALPFAAAVVAAPETGGASLLPYAVGAASGVGMIKGDIYDAVYARSKEAGINDEQAQAIADKAQGYGGENLDQIALGGAIGAVANAVGVPKQLGSLIGRRAVADVVEQDVARAAERGVVSKVARGAAAEGVPEAVQAGQERFAQNLAEQREGYDTDLMKGVLGQATFEGLAGGVLGGALGPLEGRKVAPEGEAEAAAPAPEPNAPSAARYTEAIAPRADLRDRLTTAAGEDLSRGAYAAVNALNLQLSNDIAIATPESIDASRSYIQTQEDSIDSGAYPDDVAEALTPALEEAKTILKEVQPVAAEEAAPEPVAVPTPMGEAPGTQRTIININGQEQVVEGPIRPANQQVVEGTTTEVTSPPLPSIAETATPEPTEAPKQVELKPASDWVVKYADRFAQAPELDKWVQDTLGYNSLPDALETTSKLELATTKQTGQERLLQRNHFDPIVNTIGNLGVSLPDINTFLWARGAADRNKAVAAVNADFPEGGSGMTTSEALQIMNQFKVEGLLPKLNQAARMVDDLVDFTLQGKVKAGLMSGQEAKALREAQPFYVPLKGHAADGDIMTADVGDEASTEKWRNEAAKARSTIGPTGGLNEYRKAFGRGSMPFAPLFNLFEDAERSVRRNIMNEAATPLLKAWKQDPTAFEGIMNVYTDKNPKKVLMGRDVPGGRYEPIFDMKREFYQNPNKYLVVKDKGVAHYIEFSQDGPGAELQRMFSNMRPKELTGAMQQVAKVNNFMKGMLTYKNPLYLLTVAPFRDISDAIATAMHHQNLKGSPAYKKSLASKTLLYAVSPSTWGALRRFVFGKGIGGGELDALLEEMIAAGGAPLHSRFLDVQQKANIAAQAIKELQGADALSLKERGAKLLSNLNHWVDGLADVMDMSARFATYRAATDLGLSATDAARLSLDSSLNLTRRGEMARTLDVAIPFFGAGIEGSAKTLRIIKNPKSALKIAGGLIAYGVLESLWNSMMGDDNDKDGQEDYLDLDQGAKLRMSRAVLYYGSGADDYIKIPVGQMLGYFKFVGNKIGDTMAGNSTASSASTQLVDAMKELGLGFASLLSPARIPGADMPSVVTAFTPLVGKPFIENAFNRNFFGSPIYSESFPGGAPRSELGRASTANFWKALAKEINSITGGSEAVSGKLDFQPEVYRHIIESYFGGPYQLAKQVSGVKDAEGVKDIPGIKSFIGSGSEYAPQTKYFENTATIRQIMGRLSKLSPEQAAAQGEKYFLDTDPRIIEAFKAVEANLDKINKDQKASLATATDEKGKQAVLDYYRAQKNQYYSAFNSVFNTARKEE